MIKFRNLTGIFVVYGMIFVSSAGAQSNVSDFERVKSYLNSKGKKSYRTLLLQMDKSLPSKFYEKSMKIMNKIGGEGFFESAKINKKYAYFRFNGSKVVVRFKNKKGKKVFLANGVEIHEDDFKTMKTVQGKLLLAQLKEKSNHRNKKISFLDLVRGDQAFASVITEYGGTTNSEVHKVYISVEQVPRRSAPSSSCNDEQRKCVMKRTCDDLLGELVYASEDCKEVKLIISKFDETLDGRYCYDTWEHFYGKNHLFFIKKGLESYKEKKCAVLGHEANVSMAAILKLQLLQKPQ